MVQFAGKYENYKNENLKEFLLDVAKSQGKTGEKVGSNEDNFTNNRSTIEITGSGNTYSFVSTHLGKEFKFNFTEKVEFDDHVAEKITLQSIATIDGNNLLITAKRDGKPAGTRTYEFTDDGVIVTINATISPHIVKMYYKRL